MSNNISAICEGIIPQTYFISGDDSTKSAQSGVGDKVALIGSFPKVSPTLEYYSTLRNAKSGLNIVTGLHDVYKENTYEKCNATVNGTTTEYADLLPTESSYFMGAAALKYLFHEGTLDTTASSVIVCNTSRYVLNETKDSDKNTIKTPVCAADSTSNYLLQTSITDDILKNALEQLKGEDFDILLLGFAPSNTQLDIIIEWERQEYNSSNPIGLVYGTSDVPVSSIGAITNYASIVDENAQIGSKAKTIDTDTIIEGLKKFSVAKTTYGDNHTLYACIPQSVKLDYEDKYLSPVETAAYYAGVIAGLRVNKSMTSRTVEHIEAVSEDLVYSIRDYVDGMVIDDTKKSDGYLLVEAGATLFRCTNRSSKEYYVVNSQQPCGLDLAHIRTSAYIIKKLVLDPYLGKVNNITNLDLISTQISALKTNIVSQFDILDSINYSVERASKNCIKIYLNIVFYGIILNEVVYVSEEVI